MLLVACAAILGVLLVGTGAAYGAVGLENGQVARWPLVSAAVIGGLVGLWMMGLRRAWFEMTLVQRVLRVVGASVVAAGSFGVLYGLTEAPPGGIAVEWVESYGDGQELATQTERPLMVYFTADWCVACAELDAEVFQDPSIRPRLEQEFVPVKIDYDRGDEDTLDAIGRFQVSGLPRVGFEGRDGEVMWGPSFEGKVGIDDFDGRLDRVLAGDGEDTGQWLETTLGEGGLWALFLLVFGAGVLASLSPCIYPLIPITIGVFGARAATTRREGFVLSLAYVGGIAATYSGLGVLAALMGGVFGGFFQHLWVQAGIAGIFALVGIALLGVFDIRLPQGLHHRLAQAGGAGHSGAFVMGMAAGVIAVPCIGPVVAGILVYVAEQGDLLLGWSLLAVFALGMGLLFMALGTFSSLLQRLPQAGGWMEGAKAVMGAVFLGLALYYLRLVIPGVGQVVDDLWMTLAGIVG